MVKVSSKIGILPASGYVLVEPELSQTKTSSGIYLPESSESHEPQKGKVVAVGGDEILDWGKRVCPVKVGDGVIYKKWGGNEYKQDGKDYMFVKFEDLLAVLEKKGGK
jgi:chaperonin GroES